ncbi:MAG TPA: YebC/PmpR family DNA-binding transcriptional regulator [Clostridiales bacterium]|nr:YebC/PmpR family DNA-binding transcriptional regulator [Clostridiales bacterium]
MSGHSKWANIKRRKGAVDAERAKAFTKISREIIVAVQQGGPDPDGNFRLKLMIQKAKAANMPNDNINRCIQKAAGNGDDTKYNEVVYEGYGPAGTAILLEIMTDNRNRTASEIRYLFSRNGGNLGETGCVAWMFDRVGRIAAPLGGKEEDDFMMIALDAGAEDVSFEDGVGEIITLPEELENVRKALIETGLEITDAEVTRIPKNTVAVDDVDQARQVLTLYDALDEHDDVQNAYSNFEISDDILEQI